MHSLASQNLSRTYRRLVLCTDILIIAFAMTISFFVMRIDIDSTYVASTGEGILKLTLNPVNRALLIGGFWIFQLKFFETRSADTIGEGTEEYKRILRASLSVFALLGLASLLFKLDFSRLFVIFAMALGTLLLLISRLAWRSLVRLEHSKGRYLTGVAIAGSAKSITEMVQRLRANQGASLGPRLLIATNPDEIEELKLLGLPVAPFVDDLAEVLLAHRARTIILLDSNFFSSSRLRQLSWKLENLDIKILVTPNLTRTAVPRVNARVSAGVLFLSIATASFEGTRYLLKQGFDFVAAIIFIILASPIMLVTAVLIKLTSKGPILFLQPRNGKDGQQFRMIKFRSMVVGAEALHEKLQAAKQASLTNSNMYKDPQDPRITKIGRFIRRFSIDELPQLFNVLRGEMSLVGPRPPLPSEVAKYSDEDYRRLLVKPGLTGAWQVSGRSLLTWEETVQIDLEYVENWSLAGDLIIILKTVKAIVTARGSY
jgi:exopolysaccharide biosynthesis polyprenyl glycosylphosphotransferase